VLPAAASTSSSRLTLIIGRRVHCVRRVVLGEKGWEA
jgi:hypothetical protein